MEDDQNNAEEDRLRNAIEEEKSRYYKIQKLKPVIHEMPSSNCYVTAVQQVPQLSNMIHHVFCVLCTRVCGVTLSLYPHRTAEKYLGPRRESNPRPFGGGVVQCPAQ